MQFKVYHRIIPDFFAEHKPVRPDASFELVATVECDTVDDAFYYTNHVDRDWTTWENVKAEGNKHRSTSVGDIIVDSAGKVYWCKSIGWEEI